MKGQSNATYVVCREMQQIIMKEEDPILDFFISFYTFGCTLVVNNAMQCQTLKDLYLLDVHSPKYTGNSSATEKQ